MADEHSADAEVGLPVRMKLKTEQRQGRRLEMGVQKRPRLMLVFYKVVGE